MEVFCHTERLEWCILDDEFNLVVPVYNFLLEEKERGKANNTLKAYSYDLLFLYKFLSTLTLSIEELTEEHIGMFRSWFLVSEDYRNNFQFIMGHESRIKPGTWNRVNGTVYMYLDWLNHNKRAEIKIDTTRKYKEKIIDNKKVRFPESPKNKWNIKELKKDIEYISIDKRIAIRAFLGNRDKLIFDFLYLTGLRIGEAFSFKVKSFPPVDYSKSCQVVKLLRSTSKDNNRQTKTGERDIFVVTELYKRISQYITFRRYGSKCPYLFVTTQNSSMSKKGDALSPDTFRSNLSKACKKAKLKYTPHDLRHTLATDLLEATGDILEVQRILGHASVLTTEKYTHLAQDKISGISTDTLNELYSDLMERV